MLALLTQRRHVTGRYDYSRRRSMEVRVAGSPGRSAATRQRRRHLSVLSLSCVFASTPSETSRMRRRRRHPVVTSPVCSTIIRCIHAQLLPVVLLHCV